MEHKRLFFIDTVRAVAILMMLQGHFIDSLLNPLYRDPSHIVFNTWTYLRGITAPVFFTVSGLIFIYLLLKEESKGTYNKRLKKGVLRGLMLIAIGYGLRIPILSWLVGEFNSYFLIIDVLQCIGLSLILLVFIYKLSQKNPLILGSLLVSISFLCFITEPLMRSIELDRVPILLANYLTTSYGSIFPILPWFGYIAFGGSLGILFFKSPNLHYPKASLLGFLVLLGIVLTYSSSILMEIYHLSQIELFKSCAYYNYLFSRLGHVLLIFSVFYAFENSLKNGIINRIGQKTLSVYVVHFILLFESFTGFGLKHLFEKSLTPTQAIIGALFFLFIVCVIALQTGKTNTFIYKGLRKGATSIYNLLKSKG